MTDDYNEALEEILEYWITNDPNHSWRKLVMALDKTDEKDVAAKIREKFNIRMYINNKYINMYVRVCV